jgi:hypothetical protein
LAAHLESSWVPDFSAHHEVGFFEFLQHQGDFRVLQSPARFFENRGLNLIQAQALQLDVTYDLQVDETIGLDGDRLIEFRRVAVMDLHDIGGLEPIARVSLAKGTGLPKGHGREDQGEKETIDSH